MALTFAEWPFLHRVKFEIGSHWLLDVTLDNGRQGVTKDLEPDLPLVILLK